MKAKARPAGLVLTLYAALSVATTATAQPDFLDYDFRGGTPAYVARVADHHFRVAPYATNFGAQWFILALRVNHLEAGKDLTLEIEWPPVWTASDLKPNMTAEQIDRATKLDSFLKVVPRILFVSDDARTWTRASDMAGTRMSGAEGDRMMVRMRGTGRDHEEPGRYWVHDVEGLFRTYFHELTGALSYTIEFSRHMWWNRRTRSYEPYKDHPRRFAREALAAMTEYLGQKSAPGPGKTQR